MLRGHQGVPAYRSISQCQPARRQRSWRRVYPAGSALNDVSIWLDGVRSARRVGVSARQIYARSDRRSNALRTVTFACTGRTFVIYTRWLFYLLSLFLVVTRAPAIAQGCQFSLVGRLKLQDWILTDWLLRDCSVVSYTCGNQALLGYTAPTRKP